jgi:hypothetical protein
MLFIDRYTNRKVFDKDLPCHIDLGRYYVADSKLDLTNRVFNVGVDRVIKQNILDRENKSIQELLCYFFAQVTHSKDNVFEIPPLVQSVSNKLFLNNFETMLEKELFHLEEIFRQPHYLLQRTIEKVNVSRAKRIPAKSYQNLASHTEDWLHKSIVDFKPRRILNEELDLFYDVYENQITVALVQRCISYINGRIKEVRDLKDFLVEYEKLLKDRDFSLGWYKKTERNLELIGDVYEDENFRKVNNRGSVLDETQESLQKMLKRLRSLQSLGLYNDVNNRAVQSLISDGDVTPTNVIANHKHYRCVRSLWRELNTVDAEKSDDQKGRYEQDVLSGIRSYAKTLITYIVKQILGYEVSGTYTTWDAIHEVYCPISMHSGDDGVITLTIGDFKLSLVSIANDTLMSDSDIMNPNLYILSLGMTKRCGHVISVSPYDADSAERVGRLIKEYILRNYLRVLKSTYKYPQLLRDYVVHFNEEPMLEFYNDFSYSFKGIPRCDIKEDIILLKLENDRRFKDRSRPDRDNIRSTMSSFISRINEQTLEVLNKIVCHGCFIPMGRQEVSQIEYLKCSCGFVLDSTNNHVLYTNKDPQYNSLSKEDWGMDYLEFDT